ncbi:hypothetical protein CMO92_03675 [Candidatus Woesearchaeota archaeon]|nr:hypothetical protein [Candidatus Woesearchaeota archaeon]|tara:strand:- start:329 stop:799 length:471 start_codon:yes stop_codon:yes gene_type:complete
MKNRSVYGLSFLLIGILLGSFTAELALPNPIGYLLKEPQAPQDHLGEDQIRIYKDRVVLEIPDAKWARFKATGSMVPTLMEDSNAIEVVPVCPEGIEVGDIVSYRVKGDTIIHRVAWKDVDEEGAYFVFKGDNNALPDPDRIRCSQIQRLVVALVY